MSLDSYRKKLREGNFTCAYPNCIKTKLTVDHIIPQQLLSMLGLQGFINTDDENFQYLCKFHNNQKGSSIDYTNPKTLPLLKKYINIWIEKHENYFIAPEHRVYKIGVSCHCCEIPQHLDVSKWKNPPIFAKPEKKQKVEVVYDLEKYKM